LIRDGLRRGMGEVTFAQVRGNLDARLSSGEFQIVERSQSVPARQFTTARTIEAEREIVRRVREGQSQVEPTLSRQQAIAVSDQHSHLNRAQKSVVEDVLSSPDRIQGIQGLAGTGKTTTLSVIRSAAESQGYHGSAAVPRNRYVEIRNDKPTNQKQRDWPEYKTCKFTTEAIVTEGSEKGELRRVCANPECPVHHAKKQRSNVAADAGVNAEQEKRRREEALAQATGLRVLSAIVEAVPVRLMKRDLLFVVERLAAMLDERRLAIVLRQHGIGKAKGPADTPAKLLAAFIRKAEESILGRLLVETVILHSASSANDSGKQLKEAAEFYKVDVNAITAKVKQEFAAKGNAGAAKKAAPKPAAKAEKKPKAA